MRLFNFQVQVLYNGTIEVEGKNIVDAERRVRELVKPQGVFNDELMSGKEDYEFDMHPDVYFLNHSERELPANEEDYEQGCY